MAARIAFLSIARTTFDIPLATEVSNSAREKLSAAGFKVEGHPGLLTDLELAKAAAHEIAQNPFGVGIHFCLGAPLARIEAPIAINEMLRRLPDLRLATEKVERMPDIAMRGLKSLPVTFG